MPWRSLDAVPPDLQVPHGRHGELFAFYISTPTDRLETMGIAYLSDGFGPLTGFGLDALSEPGFWLQRVHADDLERVQHAWQLLQSSGMARIAYRWQHADGTYRWFNEQVRYDRGDGHVLGIVTDAHEVLPREAYLREVLDEVPLVICRYREDGSIMFANREFCEVFGHPRAHGQIAPGVNWYRPLPRDQVKRARERNAELLARGVTDQLETWHETAAGRRLYRWRLRGLPGCRPPEIEAIGEDITAQREREHMFAHSAKLATLGEMATNTAHELNQPLAAIAMATGNLAAHLNSGDAYDAGYVDRRLARIEQNIDRARRIIENMQVFSRADTEELEPVSLAGTIDGSISLIGELFRLDNVTLVKSLPEQDCLVVGMQGRLQQVLVNLLVNARDAIRARRVRESDTPSGLIHIALVVDEVTAHVHIADNGGGVPAAVIDRIFEPFFTTKPVGQGTGLGLAIAYGIASDHHGTLTCRNDGEGAVFTLSLPLAEAPAASVGIRGVSGG